MGTCGGEELSSLQFSARAFLAAWNSRRSPNPRVPISPPPACSASITASPPTVNIPRATGQGRRQAQSSSSEGIWVRKRLPPRMGGRSGNDRSQWFAATRCRRRGDSNRRSLLGLLLMGGRSNPVVFSTVTPMHRVEENFSVRFFLWNDSVEVSNYTSLPLNIGSARRDRQFECPPLQQGVSANGCLPRYGERGSHRHQSRRNRRIDPAANR
jgi:hypothetical protein